MRFGWLTLWVRFFSTKHRRLCLYAFSKIKRTGLPTKGEHSQPQSAQPRASPRKRLTSVARSCGRQLRRHCATICWISPSFYSAVSGGASSIYPTPHLWPTRGFRTPVARVVHKTEGRRERMERRQQVIGWNNHLASKIGGFCGINSEQDRRREGAQAGHDPPARVLDRYGAPCECDGRAR